MSYARVCVQYHPDRFRGDSPAEAEAALKRFLEIDAAWRILKDHTSRRQYDLKLRGRSPQTERRVGVCAATVLTTLNVVGSSAQELTQDWPVDSTVSLEDMSRDGGNGSGRIQLPVGRASLLPINISSCGFRQRCVYIQLSLRGSLQSVGGGDENGRRRGGGGGAGTGGRVL